MARPLAFLALAALVCAAFAQDPAGYVRFGQTDLGSTFDLFNPSTNEPFWKVCGGIAAVAAKCKQTKGCEAFTYGGDGNCGYLKSSGGKPSSYTQALVPSKSREPEKWTTYIMLEHLAVANGGTSGAAPAPAPAPGPAPAAGGRPGFCPRGAGAVCCYKRDTKYNTCSPVLVRAFDGYKASDFGGKPYPEYLKERCASSQPRDRSFATKQECCKANGGCVLGPSARNCWVPVGRSNRCVETKSLDDCQLPDIKGYGSEEECVASSAPPSGGVTITVNGNAIARDAARAGMGIATGAIDRALGRRLAWA